MFDKVDKFDKFDKVDKLMKLMHSKKDFLLQIFANLIVQLGITYYIMENADPNTYKKIGFWMLLIFQLVIIYLLALVPMHPIVKILLFSLFSGSVGISLANLKKKYDPQMIQVAIQSALSVFGAMFAVGIALIIFGINLGPKVGAILLFLLLGLIIARIVLMVSNGFKKTLSIIGVALFSLYIVYDTNVILGRNYYGDFITASLDYYLDIINLYSNFSTFSTFQNS